jgi:hypothetical protein
MLEITNSAAKSFKPAQTMNLPDQGDMKMWHHGKYRLQNDTDLTSLHHGDVVVVDRQTFDRYQREAKLPFQGSSTYSMDFVPHASNQKAKSTKHVTAGEGGPLEFNGVSTYQMDYKAHAQTPRSKGRSNRPVDTVGPGPLPFEGSSTYNLDFTKHAMTPRTRKRGSKQEAQGSPLPFEGKTEYGSHYVYNQAASSKKYIYLEPELTH